MRGLALLKYLILTIFLLIAIVEYLFATPITFKKVECGLLFTKPLKTGVKEMPFYSNYDLSKLQGVEEGRPWEIGEVVKKYVRAGDRLLDIGSGTAERIKSIAPLVSEITALEPNPIMRSRALENIKDWEIENITVIDGKAERLPFDDETFDIVTCMLAPDDVKETWRVLKPNGYAILEKIGDRDKWNLKEVFGSIGKPQNQGVIDLNQRFSSVPSIRGSFVHYDAGERAKLYEQEFSSLFNWVQVENGLWKTWYTLEAFTAICEQTPTIRDFDVKKDRQALETIKAKFMTEKGIETEQNWVLIIAKK